MLCLAEVSWVRGSAFAALGRESEAIAAFIEGLSSAQARNDKRDESRFRCGLGEQLILQNERGQGERQLWLALELAQSTADNDLRCRSHSALGSLFHDLCRFELARQQYEDAMKLAVELRDRRMEAGLRGNLGSVYHSEGLRQKAAHYYLRALDEVRQVKDKRWEGNTRCNLGLLYFEESRLADARVEFEVALRISRDIGSRRLECTGVVQPGPRRAGRGQTRRSP